MRKTKKLAALMLAGAMAASLAACGGQTASTDTTAAESADREESKEAEQTADGETYKIGVLQLTQHVALDKTNEGFVAALDDAGIKYEIDQQNAAGEQSACQTIAEKLVNDKDDLIFAIATPAAQAVAGVTDSIPILVSAVTDPAASGLVESNEVPGGNVSGTSDLTPVKEQIDLMQQIIPDVKKVGLLYCSAEANSVLQIDMAKEALDTAGIEYEDYTVSNSNEIPTGKIGMVKIISESSVAAGVRRIEAVTGAKVEEMFDTVQDTINDLKALFNNAPDLKAAISKYIEENAGLKKQMEEFMKEKEAAVKNKLIEGAKEINGVKVIKAVLPMPADAVKNIAFQLKGQFTENLFVVIGSVFENKPLLTVTMSEDQVKAGLNAGQLVREAAKLIQGAGGGQPHFATAGGKNPDGLNAAVDKVVELAGF